MLAILNSVLIPSLFTLAEVTAAIPKPDSSTPGWALVTSALITAGLAGFWAWLQSKSKNRNDQFASFMTESEKYRKELREEMEKQQKKSDDDLSKMRVMLKDQDILIKVLEEKQSLDTKYKSIIDAIPQIVWTAKPDGNVDYYNARGYQYTGRPFSAGKDYGWGITFHPDDLEKGLEIWRNCIATGTPYYYVYRLKRGSDGMYRWHLGSAFPRINDAGEILQWVGSCTDIHDYREKLMKLIKKTNPDFPDMPEKDF